MTIWIDADSCPAKVRDFVVNYGNSYSIPVHFVANKPIPSNSTGFTMIVCEQKKDAADDCIVDSTQEADLVITRDILLAERLVKKGIRVINDRGFYFTVDNIQKKVEDRLMDLQLSDLGYGGAKNGYSHKHFEAFAKCFETQMQTLMRLYR